MKLFLTLKNTIKDHKKIESLIQEIENASKQVLVKEKLPDISINSGLVRQTSLAPSPILNHSISTLESAATGSRGLSGIRVGGRCR